MHLVRNLRYNVLISSFPYRLILVTIYRSRGIRHRQANDQAVGGFFSEIGELNTVYHLWGKCFLIQILPIPVRLVQVIVLEIFQWNVPDCKAYFVSEHLLQWIA